MSELVLERKIHLVDADGTIYDRAYIHGELLPTDNWRGIIEFVSRDDEDAVRTGQETTQASLQHLADWASGLEPMYFEGAFHRALRRHDPRREIVQPVDPADVIGAARPREGFDVVHLTIETTDAELPVRIMGSRTLVPGLRRRVVPGGDLVYAGSAAESSDVPGLYDFIAEISSVAGADLLADLFYGEMQDTDAILTADGTELPNTRRAIKEALMGVPVG